jgi:hypothetical protein
MKILIRSMDAHGAPLPDGQMVCGSDSLELVEILHSQTPFTTGKPLLNYLADVLQLVEGPHAKPLPQEPRKAAEEFLSRLASRGLVEYLPEKTENRYPPNFYRVMEAIRRSGLTNMLDRKVVGQIAQELGFEEISDWIRTHRREYAEFVLGGCVRFIDESDSPAGEDAPCADK